MGSTVNKNNVKLKIIKKMTLIRRTNNLFPSVPSFFDDFFTKDLVNWSNSNNGYGSSLPAVNIKEDEDGYTVEVAVPGLKKSDFNIELENDVLTISSEKEVNNESKDALLNFGFNLADAGNKPTRVGLKLKPTINVGGIPITYPGYIDLGTEFGAQE